MTDSRKEFEAWWQKTTDSQSAPERFKDGYTHRNPGLAWVAWQAARSSSTMPEASIDEVQYVCGDMDQLPCFEAGNAFFDNIVKQIPEEKRWDYRAEMYNGPSIQAQVLYHIKKGPCAGFFVVQNSMNHSRLITWNTAPDAISPNPAPNDDKEAFEEWWKNYSKITVESHGKQAVEYFRGQLAPAFEAGWQAAKRDTVPVSKLELENKLLREALYNISHLEDSQVANYVQDHEFCINLVKGAVREAKRAIAQESGEK